MSNNLTTFEVSAKIYGGYRITIPNDILFFNTEEDIIFKVKEDMKAYFRLKNLIQLENGVDSLHLHFHDKIVVGLNYICDHC